MKACTKFLTILMSDAQLPDRDEGKLIPFLSTRSVALLFWAALGSLYSSNDG